MGTVTLRNPLLQKQLEKNELWCAAQGMHVLRADAAQTAIEALQASVNRLSQIYRQGVRAMAEDGWTHKEIGRELGISRGRVNQIIQHG
jgi:DNA-directed RNA polymerase specialized sigma24 family protein